MYSNMIRGFNYAIKDFKSVKKDSVEESNIYLASVSSFKMSIYSFLLTILITSIPSF
jgi:hypothetical protein